MFEDVVRPLTPNLGVILDLRRTAHPKSANIYKYMQI